MLLASTLLFFKIGISQNIVLNWAKEFDGGMNQAFSIKTDNNCNVYTVGDFLGTVDFDPNASVMNLTSNAFGDAYVTKLDSAGNLIWAKNIQGTGGNSTSSGVAVDGQGNVYHSGVFTSTTDFDPGPGVFNLTNTMSGNRLFISKLDSNGNFKWAKDLGDAYAAFNKEQLLTLESSGNLIVHGIDSVYRVSPTGNVIWSSHFHAFSGLNTSTYAYETDNSDNLFFAGGLGGSFDFDPGPGSAVLSSPNGDVYFAKYSSSGSYVWAKQIWSNTFLYLENMATSPTGESYYTGSYNGTIDFDPGPGISNMTSSVNDDVFLLKLDANGNYVWSISFGGTNSTLTQNRGLVIDVDANGNVILAGTIIDTTDIDPSPATKIIGAANGTRSFVAKYDANGNFLNGESFGDPDLVGNISNLHAKNNETYLTGSFFFTNDFYPGPNVFTMNAFGGFETYIMKLDMTVNIPLPLHELDFTCEKINSNEVQLRWESQDSNTKLFEVQKSNNGLDWKKLIEINPDASNDYSTRDINPHAPKSYYRINKVSLDNNTFYSETKSLLFNDKLSAITVYPNPATNTFTIRSSKEFKNSSLEIVNTFGQIVMEQKNINGSEYSINVLNLVPGLYILKLKNDHELIKHTLLKKN